MNKDLDEETRQYIDYLHQRIQFLQQELEDSERTVLELQQETQETGPLPTVDINELLEDIDPSEEELEQLSAEDFEEFEDRMLHDPEEILEDPKKAFEEMMNAANQIEDHNERIHEVNDQIHENNENWFNSE